MFSCLLRFGFKRFSCRAFTLVSSVFVLVAACSFDTAGVDPINQDNNNNNNNETVYVCGNNVAEPGEACDGTDLGGETCISQGFQGGDLACLADCSGFDVSGCTGTGPVCGNNIREGSEVCDGTDLAGQTCISLGYNFGDLACLEDCSGFDTSDCNSSVCGNNIAEYGEVCDGTDLKGETCETQGFASGDLACLADCSGFDVSGCTGPGPVCGNNIREGAEVCDGTDLAGETCVSQGFYSGTLGCLADCSDFDTSSCSGYCGDGTINGPEVCDGTDLAGETCVSQGFYSGTLGCLADCSDFDTSGCSGYCGDGTINGDEECDGTNLGGLNTCADHGCRSNGTVTCNPDCTFNISACLSGHDEDGDGIDDNCDNCPSYYNPDQTDANGDGIGDVCEYPGDEDMLSEIVVFDPFLNDESSWTVSGGTWNYGGDVVTGSRYNAGGSYFHDFIFPNEPYAVEATFHYNQDAYSGEVFAGAIFAGTPSDFFMCTYDRKSRWLDFWRFSDGFSLLAYGRIETSVQDSEWHKIHVFYDGTDVTCHYLDETGTADSIQLPSAFTESDMSGQAGLRVYNERAVFTSFVLYR